MIDEFEFEAAYSKYFRSTVRMMYVKTHDIAYCEDAAQDAWMRAWEKRDQFRGECSIQSWVMTLGIRKYIEGRRKKRPTTTCDKDLGTRPAPSVSFDDPIQVDQIVSKLRKKDAAILVASYMEGELIDKKTKGPLKRARDIALMVALGTEVEGRCWSRLAHEGSLARKAMAVGA